MEPIATEPSAIEVERRGRFTYAVVFRYPDSLDSEYSTTSWFRWSAVRRARKAARRRAWPVETVFRIDGLG